jgi:hypothetical protein
MAIQLRHATAPTMPHFKGVGQGNGAGPAIWVAISAPIIHMLYTAGFGLTITASLSGTLVAIACFAFVDDTDVIHARADVITLGEIIAEEIQDDRFQVDTTQIAME